jgi:error-prone DNA polymerase
MSGYCELHALSNFSFLRGASHPRELIFKAHALGYAGLALTDECSLAGVVRALEAMEALREQAPDTPFKLLVGAEFHCSDGPHLVLLAPDRQAYAELCHLITRARRRAPKGGYGVRRADFEQELSHCLALWVPGSAARHDFHLLSTQARWLRDFFPSRSWIAVELHRRADDAERLATLLALAQAHALPAVAAGDVHLHARRRRVLQDVLTAIRHGCALEEAGWRLFPNGERRLRAVSELQRLYPPALLAETLRVAERCTFSLRQLHYEYPPELVPAGLTASDHLRALTYSGMHERWPQGVDAVIRGVVERELALIAELRYEHFFLTVHELVKFARSRGILCQGRGSAANSVVCYALRITEIDPHRVNLLFERFLSRERNEPPDIDVDFEHERREEIIQHIYEKYGRERAALAATVICYRTRSAIRDIGKALGIDAADIDRLARLHTWWDQAEDLTAKLAQAGLTLDAHRARLLVRLVTELVGFPRHLSQHVGGFVIAGESLSHLVPVENAAMPDRTVIQWDKDDLETLGLLKVDVLGLGMLTVLRRCFELVGGQRGTPLLRMQDIPDDDAATYAMIGRADTVGVFQIESRAQMSMLPRLRPENYYDLVIEVAIVRPGPIQGGMVHPYLQRRLAPDSVRYPSPELEAVLKRTLGVPIFQEQVMQIAIVAADFTPGEADRLRRAMAAWKRRGGLEPFHDRLLTGMARNGYTREFAEQIYQQILGFGEYGFPESHAASFALLTYVSSWLKCHEPAAFTAALINSQPMGFYQPAQLVADARRSGVTVEPPDVQVSDWDCTLEASGAASQAASPLAAAAQPALRLGLRLVRGLAAADGRRVAAVRAARAFTGIDDLAVRARLSKRAMQALAGAGALRSLSRHRHAAQWQALGTEHLPGLLTGLAAREDVPPLPVPTECEDMLADYRHLGLPTGRHPCAMLRPWLTRRRMQSSRELAQRTDGDPIDVCGLITHVQRPDTAGGVVFMSLEDEYGIINIVVWQRVFDAHRQAALESSLLAVNGTLQKSHGVIHVVAARLTNASGWIAGLARRSRDFR